MPKHSTAEPSPGEGHYGRLGAMAGLSFLAMFSLMYAMVDRFANVFGNLNQAYMAGLMTAPMVIFELALMRSMYRNARLNAALVIISLVALAGFWVAIRSQAGIGDREFLRSMIPHHSGAILMCERTELRDPEIARLCDEIVASQRREIDAMKAKLRERAAAAQDVSADQVR